MYSGAIAHLWAHAIALQAGDVLNAESAASPTEWAVWLIRAFVGASRNPLETRSSSLPTVMHHRHAAAPNPVYTSCEAANSGLLRTVMKVPNMRILTCDPRMSPITPENDLEI